MISTLGRAGSALFALVILFPVGPQAEAAPSRHVTAGGQTGTPTAQHVRASRQAPTGAATDNAVVVAPGDTLSELAARLDVRGGWRALYAANRAVIGPDADLLTPGTRLTVPEQTVEPRRRYQVVPGDTLSGVASRFGIPGGWRVLYGSNRAVVGPDPDVLQPGVTLVLRVGASRASTQTSKTSYAPVRYREAQAQAFLVARRISNGAEHVATGILAAAPETSAPGPAMARSGVRHPAVPHWVTAALVLTAAVAAASLVAEPALQRRRRPGRGQAGPPTAQTGLVRGR